MKTEILEDVFHFGLKMVFLRYCRWDALGTSGPALFGSGQ